MRIELPVSSAGWTPILEPLDEARPIISLSSVERIDFRQSAALALGKIASEPDRFGFYDLLQLEQAVALDAGLSADESTMAFGSAQLAVLSVMPTAQAQSLLGAMAVQPSGSDEDRRLAVDALLLSLQRHGNLLTSADIQKIDQAYESLLVTKQLPPGNPVEQLLRAIYRRSGALPMAASPATSSTNPATSAANPAESATAPTNP